MEPLTLDSDLNISSWVRRFPILVTSDWPLATVSVPLTLRLLDIGHFTKCNIEKFLLRKVFSI